MKKYLLIVAIGWLMAGLSQISVEAQTAGLTSAKTLKYYELAPPHHRLCCVTQDVVFGPSAQGKPAWVYAVFGLPTSDSCQRVLKLNLPPDAKIYMAAPHNHPCAVFIIDANHQGSRRIQYSFEVELQGKRILPDACRQITWDQLNALPADIIPILYNNRYK